jgi:hypothetical protein
MDFHAFMKRYTLGLFGVIKGYCDWAESQAKGQVDLFVLTLGPIGLLGLILWSLPAWLGKTIALILLAPVLYLIFVALQHYARRGGRK